MFFYQPCSRHGRVKTSELVFTKARLFCHCALILQVTISWSRALSSQAVSEISLVKAPGAVHDLALYDAKCDTVTRIDPSTSARGYKTTDGASVTGEGGGG